MTLLEEALRLCKDARVYCDHQHWCNSLKEGACNCGSGWIGDRIDSLLARAAEAGYQGADVEAQTVEPRDPAEGPYCTVCARPAPYGCCTVQWEPDEKTAETIAAWLEDRTSHSAREEYEKGWHAALGAVAESIRSGAWRPK